MFSYLRTFRPAQYPAIGIDCGSRVLKAAQVRRAATGTELVAAAAADVPAGAAGDGAALTAFFRGAVRRMLADKGFRGRRVVLSVPASQMHTATLRRPIDGDGGDDEGGQGWEGPAGSHPFPPSEMFVRTVDAGEVRHDGRWCSEVVSLAVRRDVVERYARAAADAGLEVTGITSEPEAILGALAFASPDSRLLRLVVDLGLGSTRVYAAVGRRLLFARRVPVGGAALERAVAAAVGVRPHDTCALRAELPPLDSGPVLEDQVQRKVDLACDRTVARLTQELRLSHQYVSAFAGIPVHHLVFVGGGARHRRLWQRIASGVGLPARAADPLSRLLARRRSGAAPASPVARPGFVVCTGLALDAATADDGADLAEAPSFGPGVLARLVRSA
jgi:type IV pilus assembly protein PilM